MLFLDFCLENLFIVFFEPKRNFHAVRVQDVSEFYLIIDLILCTFSFQFVILLLFINPLNLRLRILELVFPQPIRYLSLFH